MIKIQHKIPYQKQDDSRTLSNPWMFYRPRIGEVLSYPDDAASYTVIAGLLSYPAESIELSHRLVASDFASDFSRQLAKGCLFELKAYGRVREQGIFENMVSKSWNRGSVAIYKGLIENVSLHHIEDKYGIEEVIELLRGAVRELKHERFCTNR